MFGLGIIKKATWKEFVWILDESLKCDNSILSFQLHYIDRDNISGIQLYKVIPSLESLDEEKKLVWIATIWIEPRSYCNLSRNPISKIEKELKKYRGWLEKYLNKGFSRPKTWKYKDIPKEKKNKHTRINK